MRPTLSSHDKANILARDSILLHHLFAWSSIGYALSDVFDLIGRQFRSKCQFAFRPMSSSLSPTISHVVQLCSEKEMIGIAALPIVARMTNQRFLRNGTPPQSVSESVGSNRFPVAYGETPIASILGIVSSTDSPGPIPAFTFRSHINKRFKPLLWRKSSDSQMFWIAASAISAGLVNLFLLIKDSVVKSVGNSVRRFISSTAFKGSISMNESCLPRPALVCPAQAHLGPKAFRYSLWIAALSVWHEWMISIGKYPARTFYPLT